MQKWMLRLLPLIGTALIIQSVLWEFARMDPAYRRIVSPWSIRGTETVHGAIFVVVGAALGISAIVVGWARSQEPGARTAIVAMIVAMVTVIGVVFGADGSVELGAAAAAIGGAFIGLLLSLAVRDALVDRVPALAGQSASVALSSVGAVIGAVIGLLALDGTKLGTAAAMLVLFALLGIYSLTRSPRELAANRMLLFASAFGLGALVMQAGAIRQTLLRFQRDFVGEAYGFQLANIAGDYKDSEITSGWFFGVFGALVVVLASIAMWAKRRDYILAQQRARRQREAAEKSASEIKAALERSKQS